MFDHMRHVSYYVIKLFEKTNTSHTTAYTTCMNDLTLARILEQIIKGMVKQLLRLFHLKEYITLHILLYL
jgi:hypothetical protein